MKDLKQRILSYFLLLCIVASIFPLGLLHHHADETHCDKNNAALENNPCHIRIHHHGELNKNACEHESHYVTKHENCLLCNYFASTTLKYIPANSNVSLLECSDVQKEVFLPSLFQSFRPELILSRGPPA